MPASLSSRALAAKILTLVITQKLTLEEAFDEHLPHKPKALSYQDKSFTKALCYGVMRYYFHLMALSRLLLHKPFKAKDTDLQMLLLLGLYQLLYLDTPDYAAIAQTVEATRELGKPWAASLTNALLRRMLREKESLQKQVLEDEEATFNHPHWMLEQLQQHYPENWQKIVNANNGHPPFTLRLNVNRVSVENYLSQLATHQIQARVGHLSPIAVYLETPLSVDQLPGFHEGLVSVQDEAAQLAAGLLDLKAGQRVLDLCAAPGSKSIHILETCPSVLLTCVDVSERRAAKIQENLDRMQMRAEIIVEEADSFAQNYQGEKFDRILLDAPCSALGVIRRHPDIKYLRSEKELEKIIRLQEKLLRAAWTLLKPEGFLLYATCSVLPQENHDQIVTFLKATPSAQLTFEKILLPTSESSDGFYYAGLLGG